MFHKVPIHPLAQGDISELHIGLKGTMGALYLKDLAEKTRRGLEGRVHAGRCIGNPPYGYRVVRKLKDDGEVDRGLRAIDPEQAAVVRRIYESVRRRSQSAGSPKRSMPRASKDHVAAPGSTLRSAGGPCEATGCCATSSTLADWSGVDGSTPRIPLAVPEFGVTTVPKAFSPSRSHTCASSTTSCGRECKRD